MKTKWKVVSPYTGIEEDAPASSAGGGNIAGIGIDHPDRPGSGEPGIDPKKKKKKHADESSSEEEKELSEKEKKKMTLKEVKESKKNEENEEYEYVDCTTPSANGWFSWCTS